MSRPDQRRLPQAPCLRPRASFYNVGVAEPQSSRSITRTETLGLLVLAVVILVVILVRWGSVIPWSAR